MAGVLAEYAGKGNMTILRDISFLWSMLHIIIVFLLLFEPRYSWRVTIAVSLAGLPSHFAVVGWFPAANVVAVRQTAATNVNPKRFIIPTF